MAESSKGDVEQLTSWQKALVLLASTRKPLLESTVAGITGLDVNHLQEELNDEERANFFKLIGKDKGSNKLFITDEEERKHIIEEFGGMKGVKEDVLRWTSEIRKRKVV